jgi:hypothetical protein
MKFETLSPCKTCPYRKDVPVGVWDRYEFVKLLEEDANQFGALYACHQTRVLPVQQVCGGWLLDQKRRNAPCLTLRLRLMTDASALPFNPAAPRN